MCMSQRIIGSNTFIQGALPTILKNTPKLFFEKTIEVIKRNADLAFTKLRNTPGNYFRKIFSCFLWHLAFYSDVGLNIFA